MAERDRPQDVSREIPVKRACSDVPLANVTASAGSRLEETIALPSAQSIDLPDRASVEAGASFCIPRLTAARVVFGDGDVVGQTL